MDTSAPPASPPSRKEGGKSKDCPFSGRSERAKNEATAGEENPITAGASKKGRRRRSSIGQGQYSEALVGASQGLDALRAGDEDVPPEPPFLADARHAPVGGAAVGLGPMDAEPTTAPVPQLKGSTRDERTRSLWTALGY